MFIVTHPIVPYYLRVVALLSTFPECAERWYMVYIDL